MLIARVSFTRPWLLVLFSEARTQAKALDAEFASTGRLRGPLHGVPVSFKDVCEQIASANLTVCVLTSSHAILPLLLLVDIQGHDTTMGLSSLAHQPRFADAQVSRHALTQPFLGLCGSINCSGNCACRFEKPLATASLRFRSVRDHIVSIIRH